jgi:hypothetical protein
MKKQKQNKIELYFNHCSIPMKDGSVYVEENPFWLKAIRMRVKENDKWLDAFVDRVDYYWKKKSLPTKFGWDEPWKKKYKNQAGVAQDVLYPYIRAILMGLAFQELSPKKKGKVLALNEDGSVTEYPAGKKHKDFATAIKSKRRK